MVLGSSKQRQAIGGCTPQDAVARLIEGLRGISPTAEEAGVCILMEPLPPPACKHCQHAGRSHGKACAVNSPAVQTIFDTHNTVAEQLPRL